MTSNGASETAAHKSFRVRGKNSGEGCVCRVGRLQDPFRFFSLPSAEVASSRHVRRRPYFTQPRRREKQHRAEVCRRLRHGAEEPIGSKQTRAARRQPARPAVGPSIKRTADSITALPDRGDSGAPWGVPWFDAPETGRTSALSRKENRASPSS